MKDWWQTRSLKLRLTVWFVAVVSGILLGLTPMVYWLIERRLHMEFDLQLRMDWSFVRAHLELEPSRRIQWREGGTTDPNGPGVAGTWFDVWSGQEVLLRHWPAIGPETAEAPQAPDHPAQPFYTMSLGAGLEARVFEQTALIGGREVTLRVFRDESGLHHTLREILTGFALGVPLAALLAALGSYIMAGRTLKPIGEMAEQARRITSESLEQRLPNPNPHDELGQLAAVFNQTLQRLESSFESLKQFTADASHELRTPLTALRTVGEVALRETVDAQALRETIGSMLEEAQQLNDLIDSLLLLARVETGRAPLHQQAVRLNELISEVCDSVGVLAAEKRQELLVTCEPGVVVSADRLLLRQAAMNILHNAIRYSLAVTTVQVRCFLRDSQAVIEISDQGPGIAPAHRDKIFERFYRIDKARSRADGGAGLGLAIAKLSIERLGGTIELESEVGRGSRFRILIPAPGIA